MKTYTGLYCLIKSKKGNIVYDIKYIDKAYNRMLKGYVHYRFVIDMATL